MKTTFHCKCKICNLQLKDRSNALSNHITSSHKDISKEEYYLTYIDDRNACKMCNKILKFGNIQTGYPNYCASCTVKLQWQSEKSIQRKEILSKRMSENNIAGGKGRPIGSKNKNPYPVDSPKVKLRTANLMYHLHSINHWHNANIKWWSESSEEKIKSRLNKWLNSNKNIDVENLNDLHFPESGIRKLAKIFDIDYVSEEK